MATTKNKATMTRKKINATVEKGKQPTPAVAAKRARR
jgi:hypothetical protein